MISLSLPWPPSINHYYGRRGNQSFIKTDGRNYRKVVGSYCMAWKVKPIVGRLAVSIVCYPPDARKRDLDNLLKCLLDSLQHGNCFKDDGQIDLLTIERRHIVERGRIEVEISAR